MKKPAKDQVSASMLGIAVPDHGIDAVVISDGELSKFLWSSAISPRNGLWEC